MCDSAVIRQRPEHHHHHCPWSLEGEIEKESRYQGRSEPLSRHCRETVFRSFCACVIDSRCQWWCLSWRLLLNVKNVSEITHVEETATLSPTPFFYVIKCYFCSSTYSTWTKVNSLTKSLQCHRSHSISSAHFLPPSVHFPFFLPTLSDWPVVSFRK